MAFREYVAVWLEESERKRQWRPQGSSGKALKAAKVEGYVRPFHDLRHTAITNDAAAGSSELAVMAKTGHRSTSTTKTYLHLAGVVFRDEAALEQRLLVEH